MTSVAPIEAEREARIARVRSDRGWLTVVRKIFLEPGAPTTIAGENLPPGAPALVGSFGIEAGKVRFVASPGAVVTLDGAPVTDRILKSDTDKAPDSLACGGFLFQIMERGDSLAVRVRDVRTIPAPFAGMDYFPIDAVWAFEAKLVRHATPERIAIEFEGATDGPVEDTMSSPGILVFEHDGKTVEMDALLEEGGRHLYVPYRDATSGNESYGPGRFLYAPLPDADGTLVLDFNRAMLPGCAFTNYATCPVPPRRNRLKIPIRAGERKYLADPLT